VGGIIFVVGNRCRRRLRKEGRRLLRDISGREWKRERILKIKILGVRVKRDFIKLIDIDEYIS
jgi:hypothetical protein